MDRPEPDGVEIVVPFVVCVSEGGPYDDDAFTAGFECGSVDARMKAIDDAGGKGLTVTVRTANVRQLELHAMNRGFPNVDVNDHAGEYAGWSTVSFTADPDDDTR